MDNDRRQVGNLRFEPGAGLLVVGGRTAVLEPAPSPAAVVETYVELVVAQREIAPASHLDLRNRELTLLSDLLALPEAELDALIDLELGRLLGTASVIGSLIGDVTSIGLPPGPEPRRHRLLVAIAAATLGVVGVAGIGLAVAAPNPSVTPRVIEPRVIEPTAVQPRTVEPTAVQPRVIEPTAVKPRTVEAADTATVEIIELPDGGTATRTESAPAAVAEDGTDVGTAVQIERNP